MLLHPEQHKERVVFKIVTHRTISAARESIYPSERRYYSHRTKTYLSSEMPTSVCTGFKLITKTSTNYIGSILENNNGVA